jgi:DNA-binding LacI/PurR family transcriptional regulator
MAATMEQVAKLAGVSLKTVSRVVNGEENVSPETKVKVLRVISQVEFVPNVAARRLSSGRAMTIGIVLGWALSSTYSSSLVEFILAECKSHGYNLTIYSMGNDLTNNVVQAFLGKHVDGIILDTIGGEDADLRDQLDSMHVPYLIVNPNSMEGIDRISYVTIDDFNGGKTAVNYLINLGHRSIGCILGVSERIQNKDRLRGYRKALADADIPFKKSLVYLDEPSDFSLGYSGVLRLISNNNDMTAIFCYNDEVAMGVMSAIWQSGRKIPDDISVIGFDDIRYAAMMIPPLTTIRQPIDQIAKYAVNNLMRLIEDPDTKRLHDVLPIDLIVRDTCRPRVK